MWPNRPGESGPMSNRKKSASGLIDPRRKIRLHALVLIGLLVLPGNMVTLVIYMTSEGKIAET